MAKIASLFLLLFWITSLLAPAYISLSEDSNTSHWIVEKQEKEEQESEEKEFGEIEFVIHRSMFYSSHLELLDDEDQTYIHWQLRTFIHKIVLPPPEQLI